MSWNEVGASGPYAANWKRTPLKHLVSLQSGAAIDGEDIKPDGEFPVFGGNGMRGFASEYTHEGERILVGRQGALCGNINIASGRFWATEHALIATPRQPFNTRWLAETMRTMELGRFSTASAQPGIAAGIIGEVGILMPSLSHQTAIAAYLDRETGRIDGLIGEKGRFVGLLREKRVAAISHAVTRGLDPHAPLKPSGQDWLGDIPAHWEQSRLRAHYRPAKRQGFPALTVLSVYRDFGVIEKSSRDDNINKTPEDVSSYQLVEPGDLVINKMKAWQGSMGVSEYRGITSPDYIVMVPTRKHEHRYMHNYLRAQPLPQVYRQISNGIRTDQWRLEPDKFLDLPIFLPPNHEQRKIAAFVDAETARIDALIAETERSIALLREKRAALITAAVTGQIDIGSAA